MRICTPIPDHALPDAARLWCKTFSGGFGARRAQASHGIVALDEGAHVIGVRGLRDETGGFLAGGMGVAGLLYRAAPATSDLVIDGIVAHQRRQGIGRALILAAQSAALTRGRKGLRAEVQCSNRAALTFYQRLGFTEETTGRFGWPWSGRVAILRKPV
ncbi:GNAT family N-acetyltransferase [Paracoccus sp. (in: a-proteobacteria)]|uniref:GNAT family N-acetyltransferase n=1 Tax=Paracoccus sp. TaxID=267 RepID=UPI003A88B457